MMAGLVFSVGSVVMLKALMHAHCQRAAFLWITLLVTVITADSPVSDEPHVDRTLRPMDFLKDVPTSTGSSPSALPTSHFTAFRDPDLLPSIPEPKRQAITANAMQWEHVTLKSSKSLMPSDLVEEAPHPLPTSPMSPSEPVFGSDPQFETLTKSSTDWKPARTNSTSSHSPAAVMSLLQPQSNAASLAPPTSSKSAVPQFHLTSEQPTSDAPPSANSKKNNGASEQNLPISLPGQPLLKPTKVMFPDYQADAPEPTQHLKASSNVLDTSFLSPSSAPLPQSKPAHVPNMLLNPDDILAPSFYVPFFSPHPTSPLSEPTEVSPEEFFPTNTMDVDWGSGDYLETMSFMGSEGDDYAMVTKVPSDMYDLQDSTETYDTSFPSRVGISLSSRYSLHASSSPSLMTAHSTTDPPSSVDLSSSTPALQFTIKPTPSLHSDIAEASDIDWFDTYTIEPTDVLLPDMNSLEYYTTQLKENANSDTGAEQRGNITMVPLDTTDATPASSSTDDTKVSEQEFSSDLSGFEPVNETVTILTTVESPQQVNVSGLFPDGTIASSLVLEPSSSVWDTQRFTTVWSAPTLTTELDSSALTSLLPNATAFLPDVAISSSSFTDVHWFVTDEPFLPSVIYSTPVVTSTIAFTPGPTEPVADTAATPTTETSPHNTSITTDINASTTAVSNETTSLVPPVMMGDQGVTEDGADIPATTTLIPASSDANTVSAVPTATTASTTPHQATTRITATAEASTNDSTISQTSMKTPTTVQTSRQYLCRVDKPNYLVKISFPSGATVGYAKSQIRDILKAEFNKSVELQVVDPPPKFVFRVVSGPVVYTAISIVNSLRRSGRRFLSVSPNWTTPDHKYQVHTVLQFVPSHIDVRFCNFSESIERGLTKAFAEVRRRSKESTNFTIHIVNITTVAPKYQEQRLVRQPVDITFTVRATRGYLMGSEVSNSLMKLTMVEFSYYMGFPVLQIAEPFHYPELNTSQLLRSSWVKTVLLGVLDQKVSERTFQANMERRVAMLLGEAMGLVRRVKRATSVGNSSVQIVSANRLTGSDHPMEIVYFVEGPSGQRVPAAQTANMLNSLDVQRAAIVLGYRVQGILAQPLERVASSPSESENTNLWIVIGVVIPLVVVVVIISILYWKLCRTDKLEFQPDAMTSIQQRQKSATSLEESRTSLPQTTRNEIEISEEEEWEYEEEEEEEEYDEEAEEENVEGRKRPVAPLKSKQNMTSEEEEEEEDAEEEEEEEEGEEEEDEGKDEQTGQMNKRESKVGQQIQRENIAKLKKAGEMKKEKSKPLTKGRRTRDELQAPSVKGFDFAKLHLGQQSKDDVMVIQEPLPSGPGPLPMSIKDGLSPSENGTIPTPVSKNSASSTKASRSSRRRGRISPSDGDSVLSDHSSERELTEENLRGHATPSHGKQTRKIPINVLNGKNRIGPPPVNGTNEQLSSASIFEHVDRMSRATDASRRLPNKVQLIAMQPMPVPPLHSPTPNGKLSDTTQINKEIQVALRHKSEIEHHRNKIRLRAKRKGHYDFPAMDDMTTGLGDLKDQDRIYQKAQMQIDKILDPDAQMPSIFMESKKSGRGRRSPKQRMKEQLNGGMMEADKDHLITEDSDAAYRKCPGVNNVAYVSDPDQGPGSPHRSPSPTDDVFLGPTSSPPGHAPPPPPYMPPQPSIEEARQQMHSLLDDAFALVSPTSQGSTAGITLPGVTNNHSSSSPPGRSSRPWGSSYQALGPFPSRFSELSMSPPSVQGLVTRQGIGSNYLPPGETGGHGDQLQPDSLYSGRGLYADELPSSARPRPVGGTTGTTGAQLHHLTQVGLSSRMNGYPAGLRAAPGQNGGIGWNPYQNEPEKDAFLDCPDYTSSSIFQMPRSGIREPSAPPAHLDPPGVGYLSAPPPLDTAPSTHSSASLIKAIREELLRLSQKQSAVSSYHS